LVGFACRIGHAGQIAVAVHGQRRALAEGRDDGDGIAVAVAFNRGDIAVAVGDAAQPSFVVISEGVQRRTSERVYRAEMAAVWIEAVKLAAIFGGDVEGVEAIESRGNFADAVVLNDQHAAIRRHRYISRI